MAYLLESESDSGPPQFAKTAAWFRFGDERLPKTLVFVDHRGVVTLNGTRESRQSFGIYPYGRVSAQSTIFGRPREIKDEYRIKDFASTIDGLRSSRYLIRYTSTSNRWRMARTA